MAAHHGRVSLLLSREFVRLPRRRRIIRRRCNPLPNGPGFAAKSGII
ncbi:hypothetical protein ppKF707_1086 [Metapseudomonas furukawaii]|uniref:Uncharacterized protein n=1 Tax=Metapseudomonas furukawaii TaxID=1149133 RepID=A0AAD1C5M9_METFU|nr:hypothetical protein ppKF707_1086 [Pseudomonas furukawaii]BAU76074.1 hypothetical protein KF707C_43860 [Pseudomonas furukawaii]